MRAIRAIRPAAKRAHTLAARQRFCVEALEDRRLMSAYLVTSLADTGAGSLRDAIAQANADPGADTIAFDTGLSGTILLYSGSLEISDSTGQTTITGPGAGVLRISGNSANRVFKVDPGVAATLSGITITGGRTPFGTSGAGILNDGILSVTASTLSGNSAISAGGGIFNGSSGKLTINRCTFDHNAAQIGGGIVNLGTLAVTNSTFTGNSAGSSGGAIYNSLSGSATVAITNCTISGNTAGTSGGGIFNFRTLTIRNSQVFNNSALIGRDLYNLGTATLFDSLIGDIAP